MDDEELDGKSFFLSFIFSKDTSSRKTNFVIKTTICIIVFTDINSHFDHTFVINSN